MGTKLYVTDCEGPITLDDNAFQLAAHFIPGGAEFFAKLSKYDDFLADIARKPGYVAGMTLRLFLPFLKAYGVTNADIRKYSAEHISLVPGAKETEQYIQSIMPAFVISTSYTQYITALCKLIGFPPERAFCTKLDLDAFNVPPEEMMVIRQIRKEIADLPMIDDWPDNATSFDDLSRNTSWTIMELNRIFWKEIVQMASGAMYVDTTVVGGEEKARVLREIIKEQNSSLDHVIYAGDSITDEKALEVVKNAGGAAVSFNGNGYAVKAAGIVVIDTNTYAMKSLAANFKQGGLHAVLTLAGKCQPLEIPASYQEAVDQSRFPVVAIITDENREALIKLSIETRKAVRGQAGKLG